MMQALKWLTAAAVTALVVGYGGLRIAYHFHPDNNFLGGWALVLGPVYWLGWLLAAASVLGWIGAAIAGVILKIQGSRSSK